MRSSKRNQPQTAFIFPSPLNRQKGVMRVGLWQSRLSLGRNGVRFAKCEGDGATPVADLRPLRLFLRPDKTGFFRCHPKGWRFIRPHFGWCDAVTHPSYNRLVPLPFSQSHEEMWRQDALYDAVIETNWNTYPRKQGAGSAIFIHLQRPDQGPTAGCLAFEPRNMLILQQKMSRIACFRIMASGRKPVRKSGLTLIDARK